MSRSIVSTLIAGVLLARGAPLIAQSSPVATMRGVVKGIGGTPVPNAIVQHDHADSIVTRTDENGMFRVATMPDGRNVFTVRALGYEPLQFAVNLGADRERAVSIELTPVATELEGVNVEGRRRSLLEQVGFLERQRTEGSGYFIDPEDIRRSGAVRVADLLRTVPGLQIRQLPNGQSMISSGRGSSSLRSGRCQPTWVLDGMPLANMQGANPDDMFMADDFMAVEVYPQASTAPARFQPSDPRSTARYCSVIVMWRKPEMPPGKVPKPKKENPGG
ncbi:MAG: TonB-dependent receptor [Gemmatimonadaceae bacterium]|jgi:hypothetical protein|nr:TonB-dependent receptor [Gemmatimonadaceae bacterium]